MAIKKELVFLHNTNLVKLFHDDGRISFITRYAAGFSGLGYPIIWDAYTGKTHNFMDVHDIHAFVNIANHDPKNKLQKNMLYGEIGEQRAEG